MLHLATTVDDNDVSSLATNILAISKGVENSVHLNAQDFRFLKARYAGSKVFTSDHLPSTMRVGILVTEYNYVEIKKLIETIHKYIIS